MTFTLTPEQISIIDHVKSGRSLMVRALAGAAKTTTIVLAAQQLPHKDALALAFNKKIQLELEPKVPFPVKTINGLGHSAWGSYLRRRLNLQADKLLTLRKELKLEWATIGAVNKARLLGVVPSDLPYTPITPDEDSVWEELLLEDDRVPDPTLITQCRKLLKTSILAAMDGTIDFNDQVYMPTIFGGNFPLPRTVFVDEAQDLSPLNHAMLKKFVRNQLVIIGDPLQSIYAFRGADSESMDKLRTMFNLPELSLTTSFRCPLAVAKKAAVWAPDIKSPEWAKPGEVKYFNEWSLADLPSTLTFICRNNAPLVKLALRVALSGHSVTFIGSQRIKATLTALLRDIANTTDTASQIRLKCESWADTMIESSPSHLHEYYLDRANALIFCLEGAETYNDVIRNINLIFADRNAQYIFSTGHGSKGLEWENVFHLCPSLIPSHFAETPQQRQQERNIAYVITTRSQNRLYHGEIKDFVG